MDAFSDRGSTPLASTIHSHAKWELNKNASWSSLAGHGALLFVQATIGINRYFDEPLLSPDTEITGVIFCLPALFGYNIVRTHH